MELVALKLDLATHGINARRSTEWHRNHPVSGTSRATGRSTTSCPCTCRDAQRHGAFPSKSCPWSAPWRLTACFQQDSHHLALRDATELHDGGMQPILAQDSTLPEAVFVVDHARDDDDLLRPIKKLLDTLVQGLVMNRIENVKKNAKKKICKTPVKNLNNVKKSLET